MSSPPTAQALPPLPFNPTRLRSFVLRLPLFTRLSLLIIAAVYVLSILPFLHVAEWGALKPSAMHLTSMHRLNTFVFIHNGFFHALVNIIALAPLLERFEAEHGTLTTVLLFIGPLSTIPAGLYLLVDSFIMHRDDGVVGASVWVFLLFASEALRTYNSNPHFALGPYRIPTWTSPLIACVLVSLLLSNTSLLGHLAGIAVGYLYGLGMLRFLVPPEKILRFIEDKLNLFGRLPHYVSVDQKTYGRYGILPTNGGANGVSSAPVNAAAGDPGIGGGIRLGP
ncbi:putative rhomboid protease [Ascosphaera atra]|nr:putative rhomboid protease [Ascosphaera atra]